ncbi:MAG: hypothetical protein F6J93_01960 [Oscillatoria sp. SIO1A7]|nr:hypothetical protein [Oscillatoria sp. SIO1A7]
MRFFSPNWQKIFLGNRLEVGEPPPCQGASGDCQVAQCPMPNAQCPILS